MYPPGNRGSKTAVYWLWVPARPQRQRSEVAREARDGAAAGVGILVRDLGQRVVLVVLDHVHLAVEPDAHRQCVCVSNCVASCESCVGFARKHVSYGSDMSVQDLGHLLHLVLVRSGVHEVRILRVALRQQ